MVEIKHLCLCLLFSSTHFSVYKDTFAFCKDTKCVQGHAILMPEFESQFRNGKVVCLTVCAITAIGDTYQLTPNNIFHIASECIFNLNSHLLAASGIFTGNMTQVYSNQCSFICVTNLGLDI